MAERPGGDTIRGGSVPGWSQMLPLPSKWRSLGSKGFFVPVLALLAAMLFSPPELKLAWAVAIIIAGGTHFFVDRLCGKEKSWLVVFGTMAFAFLVAYGMAQFDFVLEPILPGNVGDPNTWGAYSFGGLVFNRFFAEGLPEELVKIVPVLLLLWLTPRFKSSSDREAMGVSEPLDGITLAAASAAGFALSETMFKDVPRYMDFISKATHGDLALAQIQGLSLTVHKLITDVCGNAAYSGYFGYMVGLAAMKPKSRWKILGFGYLLSATLHTLWAAARDTPNGMLIIGVLSYASLATAIFKAREISPNRALLRSSIILGARRRASLAASRVTDAMVAHAAAGAPVPKGASPILEAEYLPLNPQIKDMPVPGASPQRPSGSLSLKFGSRRVVIVPGLKLLSHQIPGLRPQTEGGPVAEVTKNPQDPTVLGLRNLSASTWQVLTTNGVRKELLPGQAIRLSSGTRISFGAVDGEVA